MIYEFKNKIFNKDCIEGMKQFPLNSVDLIVTDPPYNIAVDDTTAEAYKGIRSCSRNTVIASDWDKFTDEEFYEFNKNWIRECYNVLKPKGHLYVFNSFVNIPDIVNLAKDIGFKLMNIIIWYKPNSAPTFSTYKKMYEPIMFFRKWSDDKNFKLKEINDPYDQDVITRNILTEKERVDAFFHPSPKPLDLLRKFILKHSEKGDIVLDPFLGSFSTAVACIETGRNYVGFEIDEKYYKLGLERIKKYEEQAKGNKWW